MGIVFGIFIIIAALIYIPYKLYSEASQDQKDIAKGGCLSLCIEALVLLALFASMNVFVPAALSVSEECGMIVGVIHIIVIITGVVVAYVKANKFEDPEKKEKKGTGSLQGSNRKFPQRSCITTNRRRSIGKTVQTLCVKLQSSRRI